MPASTFAHPEPEAKKPRIQPVFLPFHGCPSRCIFCAQTLQTGRETRSVDCILRRLRQELDLALEKGAPPRELAFYGGTFTALRPEDQQACLNLAAAYREKGLVSGIRCSTRPDAVSRAALRRLKEAGLGRVELGVQSFTDAALSAAKRGYDGRRAREACLMVQEAGLSLGVQLMPGLISPSGAMSAEEFLLDAVQAASLSPATARLYPCLVIEGTELAALWRQGRYAPWSLDESLPALAKALLLLWRAGVRVIRLGVATEPGLEPGVLAGPRHPALGNMARALALLLFIKEQCERNPGSGRRRLSVPKRFQGELWGHARALAAGYAALGLFPENVRYWDEPFFALE
jgi:histone acetyltransferase (RNA polymerase elongator complex component)